METLNRFKDMSPCPAEALVAHLGELLPRVAGPQERYKVTEVPTLRTLRFYRVQGLLDKPLGYEGRTALYGYRHLLQAVVIKVLQANLLPLRKIREMLQDLSNAELERFLEIPIRTGRAAQANPPFPRKQPSKEAPPPEEATPQSSPGVDLPLPQLQEFLHLKLKALPEPDPAARQEIHPGFAAPPGARTTAWRRLEVEPGIELHLRQDITLTPGSRLEVLLTRIKYLLTQESGT